MDSKKIADLEAANAAAKTAAEAAGGTDEALNTAATDAATALQQAKEPSQAEDPIRRELEKVQKQGTRTEAEKAAFSLKSNANRAKELGIDVAEVLGLKTEAGEIDKDAPLTVGMYEQMQKDKAQKTALQLADDIGDDNERELIKHYITNRIVPSGDPQADFALARGMVNSVKTGQIVEELGRKSDAKAHSRGPSAPPKTERGPGEFTPEEQRFMKPPFSLTQAQIIAARPKA